MDLLFSDALKLNSPNAFSIMAKPAGPLCNLNCTYCYYLEKQKLYPGNKDFRMTDVVLESFVRQYIESQDIPVVTFTWQGGEPTLCGIQYFENAVKLQRKYSGGKTIENAFQTNGIKLDNDWCSFLSDNNFLVGISVDGEEHVHDYFRKTVSGSPSFLKVMKGIELLHKHRVEFNTLSTVNSYSVHFASETYRFLKKTGSGYIQFLPVVERNPNEKSIVTEWSVKGIDYGKFLIIIFDEWVRSDVGKYYVQAFDTTLANYVGEMPGLCVFSETCGDALALEHNGDLYSCDHYVYPENCLGNIMETPLTDLVKSQKQFDFGINKRNKLPRYCLHCDVRYACHGECPKHRFINSPDGESGLNYLCEGYKLFFHHVEPYMSFMAKELKYKRPPANVMQWIRNRESQAVKPVMPERNDPCLCGSGKKFKNCCSSKFGLIK